MDSLVIETHGLTRNFGDLVAVDGVELRIDKGELFGLLGPNGAGKTTLLKLLTGQLEPTKGRATVLGLDPAVGPLEVKSKVGIVPEIGLPPSFLTVKEYLHYVGLIRDIKDLEGKVDHWLDHLELREVQNTIGKDLSKGTRQKLMLASGFIHEPPLLFLDEPFIGLDPIHQKKVREYLTGYRNNGGTVFMCTHILEIAEKMCTKLAIINRGKVVKVGTTKEIIENGETLDAAFMRYMSKGLEAT